MNVVAPIVTAERAGGRPRPANRRQSFPNLNSDGDGCSNKDELGGSGTRMNVPWDPTDEQRLLASRGSGSSASSKAGLSLQYVHV
jgi:hypothetical protein